MRVIRYEELVNKEFSGWVRLEKQYVPIGRLTGYYRVMVTYECPVCSFVITYPDKQGRCGKVFVKDKLCSICRDKIKNKEDITLYGDSWDG